MASYLEQYGVTEEEYDAVCAEAHQHFDEQQQQQEEQEEGADFDDQEGDDKYWTPDPLCASEGGEDRMLDLYMEDRMSGGMDF